MRAPDAAATLDEIVINIVEALQPWKPQLKWIEATGHHTEKGPSELRDEIAGAVREAIGQLRETMPQYYATPAKRKTRNHARKLLATMAALERQLKSATPELRFHLGPTNPIFLEQLGTLRRICNTTERGTLKPGDQVRRWCALRAFHLIHKFSMKEPISKTDRDPFRAITGLMYEAVTGKPGLDLERACDDLLKATRAAIQSYGAGPDNSQAK